MASNLDKKVVTGDALVSILTQSVTSMNNKLNNRPCISIDPGTGHFIINEVDSGVKAVGEDGKSVSKIELDSNNNVTATFTDGTSQVIGTLNINVESTLLTNEGFGGIRYYNGKFQYIKDDGSWGDIVVTNNDLLLGVTPGKMKRIKAKYDTELGKNVITIIPPNDTIIDNQTICFVEKIIIRRKKDSVPENITDGEDVMTLWRKDFEKYQKAGYIDEGCNVINGDIWYYRAFPTSTLGLVNTLEDTNVCDTSGTIVYGFTIDQNESDPDSMITYIEDNADFMPAHMDYAADSFDYGSWKDVWFIKDLKPCMLKYDGTVDYELDKNDYSKKADGSGDSDIANIDYEGNAMVGIPKVYWKIVDNEDDTANIYFSNKKVDEDYHCWSHMDANGDEIDYCYISLYIGGIKDNKLRCIYNGGGTVGANFKTLLTACQANNLDETHHIWDMITYSDNLLINLLLILISKTTNSQAAFGNGHTDTNGSGHTSHYRYSDKGLFYGAAGYSGTSVKVFGISPWWGNYFRVVAGIFTNNYIPKVKMTYGTEDGSRVKGYNLTGDGYISLASFSIPTSSGYVKKMLWNQYGFYPSVVGGSASTYYCDGCTFFRYPSESPVLWLFGGCHDRFSDNEGIFSSYWYEGEPKTTFLSCKPFASTQSNS